MIINISTPEDGMQRLITNRQERAREAVVAHRQAHDVLTGQMSCPNCGGGLAFATHPGGAVTARCATKGCVDFTNG